MAAACAWLVGCASVTPYPAGQQACYERMQGFVEELAPGFAALGYQPKIQLLLDDRLPDAYGLHAMSDVMGDALPGGRIRLRAASLCGNDALARAVLAHEMAHVALQHRGTPSTGLVLAWEGLPRQEQEADRLGLAALRQSGTYPLSEAWLGCHVGDCASGGRKDARSFRGPPLRAGRPPEP